MPDPLQQWICIVNDHINVTAQCFKASTYEDCKTLPILLHLHYSSMVTADLSFLYTYVSNATV